MSVCDIFPRVDVEVCSACECNYLQIGTSYSNLHQQSKSCGRYSYNYLQGYLSNVDSTAVFTSYFFKSTGYLRFVSDDTVHYTGFKLTFIAISEAGG